MKNRSLVITAEVEVPAGGANGAILVQGGRFGGWALYAKDGVPAYAYNFLGLQRTTIGAGKPLAPGMSTIRFEFAYDGNGPGKGGAGTLFVKGEKVGRGRVARTQPYAFSVEDGTDVGVDTCTPVVEDYQPGSTRFTGTIRKVVVEVKAMTAGEKADEQKAVAEGNRRRRRRTERWAARNQDAAFIATRAGSSAPGSSRTSAGSPASQQYAVEKKVS